MARESSRYTPGLATPILLTTPSARRKSASQEGGLRVRGSAAARILDELRKTGALLTTVCERTVKQLQEAGLGNAR